MKNESKNVLAMVYGLLFCMLAVYTGKMTGVMHVVHNVLIGATLMSAVIGVYGLSIESKKSEN